MSLSILWLFALIMFVLVACFQSRNRLLVYDLALVISLALVGAIYLVDKYLLGLQIARLLSEISTSLFSKLITPFKLSSEDSGKVLWAASLFAIFMVIYIFLHIVFKFLSIGRNPILPYKKKDYLTHFGLSFLFVVCGFIVSTYIFTFIKPLAIVNTGFIEPLFNYLYEGLRL